MDGNRKRAYRDWLITQRDFFTQAVEDLDLLERCNSQLGAYCEAIPGKRTKDQEKLTRDLNYRFGFDDSE